MKHQIHWTKGAINELTEIYLNMLDKGSGAIITQAAARIDRALEVNPAETGESRDGDERIMFETPLTVYFEVRESEPVAVVTSIRRFRTR